jgi:diadenosine tetraphosphate (Ap4A) HIT family hydrolase
MVDCAFCQIANQKIPAEIIYQDDKFIAFLDNHPQSTGHTLIIPREHFTDLLALPNNLLVDMIITVKKLAQVLTTNLEADGFNLYQNNGRAAGQIVDHFHFHIIPRYQNEAKNKTKNDLAAVAKKINQGLK